MSIYKPFLILFLFLTASCLQKRDRGVLEPNLNSKNKNSLLSNSRETQVHQVYALNEERETINAQELLIYRASLARTELGKLLVPKLSFGVDRQADYVEWKACPHKLAIACIQGSTMHSEVYIGLTAPDLYTVSIKACVNPIRASIPEKNCGPIWALEWHQNKAYDPLLEDQISELLSKEHEIHALGESLHELLAQFKKELKFCQSTGGSIPIEASELVALVNDEIDKQLENLLGLGPKFIAEHMGMVEPQQEDEELAAIVEPILVVEEDNSYIPKGLSLQQETLGAKLDEYFSIRDVRILKTFQAFPGYRIEEFVRASSGVFPAVGVKLTETSIRTFTRKEFAALSSRERAAAMGGALLQNQGFSLSSSHQRESYGAAQMIRAMLWLQKPSSFKCEAFDRVERALTKTREQLQRLRDRILELKAILVN
ncbi:MAG: hypothetical protein HRU09_09895 [Oligoflexales bacterium]|nr:hypothetical protein [Oligoflexales bacterium]